MSVSAGVETSKALETRSAPAASLSHVRQLLISGEGLIGEGTESMTLASCWPTSAVAGASEGDRVRDWKQTLDRAAGEADCGDGEQSASPTASDAASTPASRPTRRDPSPTQISNRESGPQGLVPESSLEQSDRLSPMAATQRQELASILRFPESSLDSPGKTCQNSRG